MRKTESAADTKRDRKNTNHENMKDEKAKKRERRFRDARYQTACCTQALQFPSFFFNDLVKG
jgi:hypothetical protein